MNKKGYPDSLRRYWAEHMKCDPRVLAGLSAEARKRERNRINSARWRDAHPVGKSEAHRKRLRTNPEAVRRVQREWDARQRAAKSFFQMAGVAAVMFSEDNQTLH